MKIGYCPTMSSFVKKIKDNDEIKLINLGSAGQVLYSLKNNEIDIGIIGRKSKQNEFNGYEYQTQEGYTLVTSKKSFILNRDLKNLEIHTNLPKEIIFNRFPYLNNIIYEKSLINILEKIKEGYVCLISWDKWDDKFNLLIPIDVNYNKNPDFRVPFIYSKSDIKIKKLLV